MAILKYIIAIFCAICLSGCFEDFNPDIESKPVLCLNSLIKAGEPIYVNLSHSWLYTDTTARKDHSVSDAIVTIYANGNIVDDDYIPAESDHIRIVAESEKYGHAEAEVTVPVAVPIKSLKFNPKRIQVSKTEYSNYNFDCYVTFFLDIEIEIEDHAGIDNFYELSYKTFRPKSDNEVLYNDDELVSDYINLFLGGINYDTEPIFSEHIGVFESAMGSDAYGFTYFTDRQFSGKSYILHLECTNCYYQMVANNWNPDLLNCGYEIELRSISQSYYNWANFLWQYDDGPLGDFSEVGFVDPMSGYSNVSSGAGVIAAQSSYKQTINLREFLGKAISDAYNKQIETTQQ